MEKDSSGRNSHKARDGLNIAEQKGSARIHDFGHDNARKRMRWLSFAKSKVVFGLDQLHPADIPLMTSKPRGVAISFECLSNWPAPNLFFDANDGYDIVIHLSMSCFHLKSKCFFGSTWMGAPVALNTRENAALYDIDYADVVYLITRISDPNCIAILEIVASKINSKGVTVAQYG